MSHFSGKFGSIFGDDGTSLADLQAQLNAINPSQVAPTDAIPAFVPSPPVITSAPAAPKPVVKAAPAVAPAKVSFFHSLLLKLHLVKS